jgi:hypothetical protein
MDDDLHERALKRACRKRHVLSDGACEVDAPSTLACDG